MGPSRLGGRPFAWKKLAIGAIVIIGLVWVVTPTAKRRSVWNGIQPGECEDNILIVA